MQSNKIEEIKKRIINEGGAARIPLSNLKKCLKDNGYLIIIEPVYTGMVE